MNQDILVKYTQIMQSGIFAIAHLNSFKLYVSEISQLQTRWQELVAQFREGTYPDSRLQQAWNENRHRRKFTFHTALEIAGDDSIVGRTAFLSDLKALAALRSREEPPTAQLER